MSEVIETEGMIIVNLEEGEDPAILLETVKKYPNRQIAVSVGTRITAEYLASLAAGAQTELTDMTDIMLFGKDLRTEAAVTHNDFWVRGESRNPNLKTNGLPYRRGKGKNRY